MSRNLMLERKVFARADRLKSFLQPGARAKLDLVTRGVLARLASGSKKTDPYTLAKKGVCSKFPRISIKQCDLLSFYVLTEGVWILTDRLDGMNELSEMTALRLQMTMDRRSKFMSTLNNIMKKISTTQEILTDNLK